MIGFKPGKRIIIIITLKDKIFNSFKFEAVVDLIYLKEKLMIRDVLCQPYQPYGNIVKFGIVKVIKFLDFQGYSLFCLKYKMPAVPLFLLPFSLKFP